MPGALALKDPLDAVVAEARDLLTNAEKSDVRGRYKLGAFLAQVGATAKYGSNSIGRLAERLGRRVSTFYRYKRVAETWEPIEIENILKKKTAFGTTLTWSHLELLAEIENKQERQFWITTAISTGMRVRALRDKLCTNVTKLPGVMVRVSVGGKPPVMLKVASIKNLLDIKIGADSVEIEIDGKKVFPQ